jgi:protein SCO1
VSKHWLTGCSSSFRYLMDPEMKFVKFYGKNYDTDSLADGIVKEIKEHK